ncbi:hypothetical protein DdX_14764 [Ditylenchus destructor]|uniref:Uncharacterized protein n=1 Tax=Ditylenchus destructor TaxID=166010 RepID=A0AAD4MSM5_9BILA|nr:hypothetical protein DdX_14764 [Ditylenchus destructor]
MAISFLLLIFLCCCVPDSSEIDAELSDISALLDKFNTLTANSNDAIQYLGLATTVFPAFIKYAVPAGSIVIGAVDIATKPESPVYKEIMKLRTGILNNLDRIQKSVYYSTKVIAAHVTLKEYMFVIQHKMLALKRDIADNYLNPSQKKTNASLDAYHATCTNEATSPIRLLDYLFLSIVDRCGLPTKENAEKLSIALEILQLTGNHLHNNSPTIQALFLRDRQGLSFQKYEHSVRYVMDKLNQDDVSTDGGIPCMLQDILDARAYRRSSMHQFAEMVRKDVSTIALYGSHCAQIIVSNRTDDEKTIEINKYLNNIKLYNVAIFERMEKWIPLALEHSWPKIARLEIQSAIDDLNLRIPVPPVSDYFQLISERVLDRLADVGSDKFEHQIVATPNITEPEDYHSQYCNPMWCISIRNYFSVNIFATRFPLNDKYRSAYANLTISTLQPGANGTFVEALDFAMRKKFNANTMTEILEYLLDTSMPSYNITTPITSESTYRSLVAFRDYTFRRHVCNTKYGLVDYHAGGVHATYKYHYKEGGSGIYDCEDFVFIFFL